MKLTEHFTLDEMTVTSHKSFDNIPSPAERYNLRLLCEYILEPLRHFMDDQPMIINSGYRSEKLNHFVGGAKNSYHTRGLAADIHCKSCSEALKMCFYALVNKLPFAELILCKSASSGSYWVHVALAKDGDKKRYVSTQLYG